MYALTTPSTVGGIRHQRRWLCQLHWHQWATAQSNDGGGGLGPAYVQRTYSIHSWLSLGLDRYIFQISLDRHTNGLDGKGLLTIGNFPKGVDNSSLTWVPVRLYADKDGGMSTFSSAPNEVRIYIEIIDLNLTWICTLYRYILSKLYRAKFFLKPILRWVESRWEIDIDGVFLDGERLPESAIPAKGVDSGRVSALIDTVRLSFDSVNSICLMSIPGKLTTSWSGRCGH